MKKRYSISQRKCEQGLVAFYGYVAGMCNIEVTEKSTFDCTKICVTKPVHCFCVDLKQISQVMDTKLKLRMVLLLRANKWQVLH